MSTDLKRFIIILVFLWLVCVGLRLNTVQQERGDLNGDEEVFTEIAHNLEQGKGFINESGNATAWRSPGFPAFLVIIYKIFGADITTVKFVLVLITSLIAPLLALFTLLIINDQRIAFMSGLLWAFLTNSWWLSPMLVGEELATLLFLICLLFAKLALTKKSFLLILISSIFFGLAVLTRAHLLLVIFAVPLWLFVNHKKNLAIYSLLFSSLLIGGWGIRNYLVMDHFTLSTQTPEAIWMGSSRFARGSTPGLWNSYHCSPNSPLYDYLNSKYPNFCGYGEIEKAQMFSKEIKENMFETVKNTTILLPKKILIFFSFKSYMGFDFAYLIALCFSIIGVISLWKRNDVSNLILLVSPIILVLILNILTYADPRHRHSINPLIMVLGALGLVKAFEYVGNNLIKSKNIENAYY